MMGDSPVPHDILHAQIHHRQRAVLHEINQLNLSRPGILQMEVDVRIPKFPLPPSFALHNICSLIESNKLTTQAHIYFHPKYTLDKKGRDELFSDLLRASLKGGDRIVLRGTGNAKGQCMYIRCSCALVYQGTKIDKVTGQILDRTDYRNTTYSNNRRNQRHGQTGRNASHRTTIDRRFNKGEASCPFHLSIFRDGSGYFIKSKLGSACHEFHPCRDHLRTSLSLLADEDNQLHADLNSARAKVGTAANLHYVRTGRLGTPTVLSCN
jgi:hypothetical protein